MLDINHNKIHFKHRRSIFGSHFTLSHWVINSFIENNTKDYRFRFPAISLNLDSYVNRRLTLIRHPFTHIPVLGAPIIVAIIIIIVNIVAILRLLDAINMFFQRDNSLDKISQVSQSLLSHTFYLVPKEKSPKTTDKMKF